MSRNYTTLSELNDESLFELSSKGNSKAFEMLYDKYAEILKRFAFRFVQDIHLTEDVVQEVFVKVIEAHTQFDGKRKLSTWLFAITANECKNKLRNIGNRSRILNEMNPVETSRNHFYMSEFDKKKLKTEVQKVFKTLKIKEQQLFVLKFEQELSVAEIAECMHIPEGSVKSGVFYLLKKMAKQLKEFKQ